MPIILRNLENSLPVACATVTPCIALYGSNGTSTTNIGAPAANAYRVTITAKGGNTFSIDRASTGVVAFPCTVAVSTNRGGCPSSGRWN